MEIPLTVRAVLASMSEGARVSGVRSRLNFMLGSATGGDEGKNTRRSVPESAINKGNQSLGFHGSGVRGVRDGIDKPRNSVVQGKLGSTIIVESVVILAVLFVVGIVLGAQAGVEMVNFPVLAELGNLRKVIDFFQDLRELISVNLGFALAAGKSESF